LEKRYDDQPGALLELLAGSHARGASGRLVRLAYVIGQRVEDPALRDALEIILYPAPYGPTFAAEAARHGLSESAVLGLARQESAFDARIDSGAGARGLMQLMPEVGRRLWNDAGRDAWHVDRLYDPAVNVELGCVLLAEELKRSGGNLPQALAAYNAGGEVAEKWMSRLGANDPPEMYVDLVEYAETRSYLKNVLGNIETYRRLYALP
jgi:soluble lytic murein transglycosylase